MYQRFDANGSKAISKKDQSNDECHEQANKIMADKQNLDI